MIFTLYYMYATIIQWWRLQSLRNKLSGTLTTQNALMVCCGNIIAQANKPRCLENLLLQREDRIMCTVMPRQVLDLSRWLAFPKDLMYFPIHMSPANTNLKYPKLYLLIHAHLDTYEQHQSDIVQVENFGELVAWKTGENLEIILKTDMDNLTKLVYSFSNQTIDINHELSLLKIEIVDVSGIPSRIKYVKKYNLDQKLKYSFAPVHWREFVKDVRALYSKINDEISKKTTDAMPKITFDSGDRAEEVKKVPVSQVKPIKKESKRHLEAAEPEKQNTLDVNRETTRKSKSPDRRTRTNKSEPRSKEQKARDREMSNAEAENRRKEKRHRFVKEANVDVKRENQVDAEEKQGELKPRERHKSREKLEEREAPKVIEVIPTLKFPTSNCNNIPTPVANSRPLRIKPPNVLVYADSIITKESVKSVLYTILNRDKYIIYDLPTNANTIPPWNDSTTLVVVCGTVTPFVTLQLLQYLLGGGQLLCLCSDLLYSVLHTFTTAEVREHELVRFSYGEWRSVKMMHHIFCYQASPAKKQFSKDSDQSNHSNGSSPLAPRTPSTVELHHDGKNYNIQVQVLGTEETWQTPSLLLASINNSQGRAVFSQVHLEIDPTQYQEDENKYTALMESNQARLEILKHILFHHLDMDCTNAISEYTYTPAYFLGRHDLKQNLLSECADIADNIMTNEKITVTFFGKAVSPPVASANHLPVLVHACPSDFSTVLYFETLKTEELGRLVIYTDILTSSQFLIINKLKHGFTVIPRQQTQGLGRSGNTWLSPSGCAMFSMQLHISLDSPLGRSMPLIQHLIMISVVSGIRSLPGYENIRIGLKWPNDLYADSCVKIGGTSVQSTIVSGTAFANLGCGVNLDNADPTTCINDIIRKYNEENKTALDTICYEKFFAVTFNELERIFKIVQNGDVDYLYDLYYKYWLHSDAEITVHSKDGHSDRVRITGIDDFGFLTVRLQSGKISSVQPDGNTFDMLKGLIAPKIF